MSEFYKRSIEAQDHGMCGSTSYIDVEELYQEFKQRFIKELADSGLEIASVHKDPYELKS